MFIEGIGIQGYRSFTGDIQLLGPFGKVNLLAGQNNAGKSNVLLFLKSHYSSIIESSRGSRPKTSFTDLDKPQGNRSTTDIAVAFGMKFDGQMHEALLQEISNKLDAQDKAVVDKILKSETISRGTSLSWFPYTPQNNALDGAFQPDSRIPKKLIDEGICDHAHWNQLWMRLTGTSGGSIVAHWVPEILNILSQATREIPSIEFIPAIRRIGDGEITEGDFSGTGIIKRLVPLQNPDYKHQDHKKRFDQINVFLRDVIENKSATLEVPHDRNMIIVHMDGKTLPLSSLGTGIHEVVILAVAATILENQVLCIEEPELHLHPLLQKKLLRYMSEKTSNQYFMTTHSAHLLDTPGTAIFHVTHEDGATRVRPAYTADGVCEICADLGYRPSDLLQCNSIIWVEGPSDRIYIKHWLGSIAPELEEGVHFSIMFYGGRLLSHLSATEEDVEEFVSLRRINRRMVIVIDSDKDAETSQINDTKKRIQAEFDGGPGFAWVTKGREIENYIPSELMEAAVKDIAKDVNSMENQGLYSKAYSYKTNDGDVVLKVDKIKLAHAITQKPAQLSVLDLEEKMKQLAEFIRKANGLA